MITRRAVVFATLAICTLLISPSVFAPHPLAASPASAADDSDFTLEGKITEKHGAKLTVSTGENIIFHVVYNDSTVIKKKDGTAATGQDLRTGVVISVAGNLAESGEITAKTIEIQPAGAGKQ